MHFEARHRCFVCIQLPLFHAYNSFFRGVLPFDSHWILLLSVCFRFSLMRLYALFRSLSLKPHSSFVTGAVSRDLRKLKLIQASLYLRCPQFTARSWIAVCFISSYLLPRFSYSYITSFDFPYLVFLLPVVFHCWLCLWTREVIEKVMAWRKSSLAHLAPRDVPDVNFFTKKRPVYVTTPGSKFAQDPVCWFQFVQFSVCWFLIAFSLTGIDTILGIVGDTCSRLPTYINSLCFVRLGSFLSRYYESSLSLVLQRNWRAVEFLFIYLDGT